MANEEQVAILEQGVAVWNHWRTKNPGVQIDLTYLDFPRTDLRYVDLSYADLSETGFMGANLGGADFEGANLTYVDFENANLTLAKLNRANFHRTFLSQADFSHAELSVTIFVDVDLSTVKGLEAVQHRAPSSIGIDTIYKSKGQIPEIFLRGCGVPDIFIEYMHALTDKPFDFHHCYIGYSPEDEAFATRLHDTLQGKGVRCWTMEKNAKLGVPVTRSIEHGIRITDKLLVCCSKGISK